MSLFSINNILLNESTVDDMKVDNLGYNDTEIDNYSFTQEGYNMILALNADFIAADKVFFENVLGSHGEDMIINESFSDFFQKIKDIIKKFIDWLKKVFKDFVIKLNGLVSSDKYIKKHHKELNKFGSEHEFDYKGYKFEHTTFRADGSYSYNRHPNEIAFSKDIKEDVLRRDFTINALLMNKNKKIIDYTDGINIIRLNLKVLGKIDDIFIELEKLKKINRNEFNYTLVYNGKSLQNEYPFEQLNILNNAKFLLLKANNIKLTLSRFLNVLKR